MVNRRADRLLRRTLLPLRAVLRGNVAAATEVLLLLRLHPPLLHLRFTRLRDRELLPLRRRDPVRRCVVCAAQIALIRRGAHRISS